MTLKQLFAPSDMTEGTPWKKILIFTAPLLIGNIAQQLYSTVDSIVVGRYIGDNALAAVGSASPIFNLLLVMFMGISVGTSVMVAQYFGAKKSDDLSKTIGNCITLTAIASALIVIIGIFTTKPLLKLLRTPDSIIGWCNSYLKILVAGCAGVAYYNILCGVLRGLGDALSSLLYLLIATIVNTVLDILFVAKFQMGVPGVALATVIAQFLSAILCVIRLSRMRNIFSLHLRDLKISARHTKTIIRLGIPSGITQGLFSFAMIVVQSLTNHFGELVIAANVVIMRVDGFAMMPNFSFGTAMSTYAGQNIGAQRFDRVKKGAKQGTLMAVSISATITLILLLFGKYLMGIFTKTAELVNLSADMMKILAAGYIAMAVTQCLSGVIRGAGDTTTPMWIAVVTTFVIRIPLAYGISYLTRTPEKPYGAYQCIWISLLAAWIVGAVITSICYCKGRWKKKSILKKQDI